MAVYTDPDRTLIDKVVDRWRETCLINDGSLLFDGELWTTTNSVELHSRYNQNLQEGEGSFEQKFRQQLGNDSPEIIRLAGEIVAVHFLFPSNVGGERKRELANEVLGWGGDVLPGDGDVSMAFDNGIGSGGPGFHLRRWAHLAYFVNFLMRFKQEADGLRRELLSDPWEFEAFIDGEGQGREQMRHILLHLLFPEYFERIASTGDKEEIRRVFEGLLDDPPEDLDQSLWEIRQATEKLLPDQHIDFYWSPLAECWDPVEEGESDDERLGISDLGALEYKRQVVLYGPPGTGKTFSAKQLAARLVRHQALERWGAVEYLKGQDRINELIDRQVRRLQLHPGYSYEDFVRGMRLEGGDTVPRDGYLLDLIKEIRNSEADASGNLASLPWVLILDEINRADLSRLFGEVFSALEDRDAKIELPIKGEGLEPTIDMPEDLYVIGTMNLIDQSVEQLDFALRRRFLWLLRGFDRDVIAGVVERLWRKTDLDKFPWIKRYEWGYIASDIGRLADQAARLNDQVRQSRWLGEQYEIGHTYFFDVVGLLRSWQRLKSKGQRPSGYLWSATGASQKPLEDLWTHSLRPLLIEYLSGVDPNERESEVQRLRQAFVELPS